MRTITLKKRKNDPILRGHPWVFQNSIEREEGHGDIARVETKNGRHIGDGFYSPFSSIRVRIAESTNVEWLIQRAWTRREFLVDPETNGFRWFNAEGDGLGGLMIDRWNDTVVFQTSTLPLFNRSDEIVRGILSVRPKAHILQVPPSDAICELEGLPRIEPRWHSAPTDTARFVENGVHFEIRTDTIQKTGHYADMRPHRAFLSTVSAGKSILDLYSYTGGFALNANGATKVVAVDSSQPAIDALLENAKRNGKEIETRVQKVEVAMRELNDADERFDIIILDPPKLAPNRKSYDGAMKKKAHLIKDAAQLLNPGGLLAVGSCSALIGIPEIERLFARNTANARVVWKGGQASCHPYLPTMSEGNYLSFVVCVVG